MNKIERIDHDIKALIGNPGIDDPDGVAQWYADIGKVRYRLAVTGGAEYICTSYENEYDWRDAVEFILETSPFINEGRVSIWVKKADIESGAVRVDVFI